jgi:hypothetical protein
MNGVDEAGAEQDRMMNEEFAVMMVDALKPVREQIIEMQRLCDRRDPMIVKRIVARDDVPPRRAYRMWDAAGELTIYLNRGMIDSLPRRPGQTLEGMFYGYGFGIPIVYEEA